MLTDAELVDGVVAGYDDAFAQLYERHSSAAWRLGQTVTGNADDAADAVSEAFAKVLVAVRAGHLANGGSFRSYLLTATRNAALDNIRKTGRARPTEHDTLAEFESTSPTPPERLTGDEDAALVAEAFRGLPERWRSVLWLTEVEGVATKDAARQLHLSPNGAAQLAVRARTGLRDRFLQAHLRTTVNPQCSATVERLGAYVGGGLSPRDLAKVDQHLAGCRACESRRRELEDLRTSLRRALLPVPIAAGALGAAAAPAVVGSKVATALAWVHQAWVAKVTAGVAAGALAVGAGGAYLAGTGADEATGAAPALAVTAEQQPAPPPALSLARSEPVGPSTTDADPSSPPAPSPPAEPASGAVEPTEAPCGDAPVATGGFGATVGVTGRNGAASLGADADRSRLESSLSAEGKRSDERVEAFAALIDNGGDEGSPGERSGRLDLGVALRDLDVRASLGADGEAPPDPVPVTTASPGCPTDAVTVAAGPAAVKAGAG